MPSSGLNITLVRLVGTVGAASEYSVPSGSIGYIEQSTDDGRAHFIGWAGAGMSGPIADEDLERLGDTFVKVWPDHTQALYRAVVGIEAVEKLIEAHLGDGLIGDTLNAIRTRLLAAHE